jgi:hypothetical protein
MANTTDTTDTTLLAKLEELKTQLKHDKDAVTGGCGCPECNVVFESTMRRAYETREEVRSATHAVLYPNVMAGVKRAMEECEQAKIPHHVALCAYEDMHKMVMEAEKLEQSASNNLKWVECVFKTIENSVSVKKAMERMQSALANLERLMTLFEECKQRVAKTDAEVKTAVHNLKIAQDLFNARIEADRTERRRIEAERERELQEERYAQKLSNDIRMLFQPQSKNKQHALISWVIKRAHFIKLAIKQGRYPSQQTVTVEMFRNSINVTIVNYKKEIVNVIRLDEVTLEEAEEMYRIYEEMMQQRKARKTRKNRRRRHALKEREERDLV